ncbi:MAG TPA: cytochrome ubiquinol oxidase subunit I, partial [Novosphingobium sp.]|nr:cytochrome ubiquinol oxidase subunit I [Novosphingobium sp.]
VHTVSAGYVCAATFVMGISALYLLRGKYTNVARRSMMVASAFGLASALSVVVLGDESGYALTDNQKMKLAAIEAMWETEPAPAAITLVGLPDIAQRTTHHAVKLPYVMGLIGTRSLSGKIDGIEELVLRADGRIHSGLIAYDAVEKLKQNRADTAAMAAFEGHKRDIGFALLLKRYVADPRQADDRLILKAAWDTVPNVPVMFFLFRFMAGLGFAFIGFFALAFYCASACRFRKRWFLKLAVCMLPLPWVAIEFGWVLAEIGRQPWAVDGVLPTFLGASSLSVPQVWATIFGFTALYGTLAVIEVRLMIAAIRKGPIEHHEDDGQAEAGFAPLPAE